MKLTGRYGEAHELTRKANGLPIHLIYFSHHLVPGYPWFGWWKQPYGRDNYGSMLCPLAEIPKLDDETSVIVDMGAPLVLFMLRDDMFPSLDHLLLQARLSAHLLIDCVETRLAMLASFETWREQAHSLFQRRDGQAIGPLHYLGEGIRP